MSRFLRRFLEDHTNAHYRASLLGSLAEGLMTKSQVSGTFVSCAECGTSTTTRDVGVRCVQCGTEYELKPDASYRGTGIRLTSRTLRRRRFSPENWFLKDEDWSVADIFFHLLRLPADVLIRELCQSTGSALEPDLELEDVLFWPRLLFGRKTIQPDVAFVFNRTLVLFEFKRPEGAELPTWEIAGQVAFARTVRRELGHDWTLFVVPGPRHAARATAIDYAHRAQVGQHEAREKFGYDEDIMAELINDDPKAIAAHIRVLSWESFLEHADVAAERTSSDTWQLRSVRRSIREFHRTRAKQAKFEPLRIAEL